MPTFHGDCVTDLRPLTTGHITLIAATSTRAYAVVFLDLKKAFDTVDHNILLSKLDGCGFRYFTRKWEFESYLPNRTQRCLVNCHLSEHRSFMICGIPQGTILGILYFFFTKTTSQVVWIHQASYVR